MAIISQNTGKSENEQELAKLIPLYCTKVHNLSRRDAINLITCVSTLCVCRGWPYSLLFPGSTSSSSLLCVVFLSSGQSRRTHNRNNQLFFSLLRFVGFFGRNSACAEMI